MLLTINIANSNIKCALFEQEKKVKDFNFVNNEAITQSKFNSYMLQNLNQELLEIDSVIVCSTAPEVTKFAASYCNLEIDIKPIIIGLTELKYGLEIQSDQASDLTGDRIANLVEAKSIFNSNVIVIDIGDNIIFDIIDDNGNFKGGLILPGLKNSANFMAEHSPLLPEIALAKPKNLIGKSTLKSIQSGLINGYGCMINGLINKIKIHTGENYKIVATGDDLEILLDDLQEIDYKEADLTFKGLKRIYNLNKEIS